ncbi:hypothetical protein E4U19_007919 [Claviceps sp. Clav32 group G5]|nr:hypothetical protein E4U19_007919 [Claviceps sp. Clav32 group G5]
MPRYRGSSLTRPGSGHGGQSDAAILTVGTQAYARPLSKAMPPHRRLQGQRLVQRQEHGNLHYVSQPGERRQNLRLSLRIQGGFEASKFTKHQALGIGH